MLKGELCISSGEGVLLMRKVVVVTQSSQNDIGTLDLKVQSSGYIEQVLMLPFHD